MLGVNTDLAGYSKTGTLKFRWNNMTALFRNVLPSGATIFDPVIAYDHYAQRYVVVAARRNSPAGSWLLVGATQGTDPGGAWWVWALDARLDGSTLTNNWGDYPMLGFDTQAVYISMNMFQIGGGYQYAKFRILKQQLYTGAALGWYDFWNLRTQRCGGFTVQPASHFRGSGGNPGISRQRALARRKRAHALDAHGSDRLLDGGTPSLAKRAVNCRSYELPPDAQQLARGQGLKRTTRGCCIRSTSAGGVQRLWTCHTTKITWSGDAEARSALQWYEIDVTTGAVVQQNAFGASGRYYFFPAIQTDINRNAYLRVQPVDSTEYGHLRQTGRRVTDPANDLQNSVVVKAGHSAYTGRAGVITSAYAEMGELDAGLGIR